MTPEESLAKIKSAVAERIETFDGIEIYLDIVKACTANPDLHQSQYIIHRADSILKELLRAKDE